MISPYGFFFESQRTEEKNEDMDFKRFFSKNKVCHYIQIVSVGDNLDEMPIPVFVFVFNVHLRF